MQPSNRYLPALLAAAMMMLSGPLAAQDAPTTISEPSERIVRRELAPALYEVAYSPAENAVFVASAGGRGEGAATGRVFRLDPTTLETEAEIVLPGSGFGLALDDAAGRLYVGDTTQATVTVIDIAANTVVGTVRLAEKVTNDKGEEAFPHAFRQLVLDPARNRLYAPGFAFQNSALYVVDTDALEVETVLSGFGVAAAGVTLDAERNRLYVSNLQGELYILDTNSLEIVGKAETAGDQLLNLALDASGGRVFATDQGNAWIVQVTPEYLPDYKIKGEGNQVLVLDADNGETIRTVPTGADPIVPLFDAERARLYVTNREGRSVTVFDTGSYQLLETINLPVHPNSLTLDRENNALFVTVKNAPQHGAEEGAAPQISNENVVRIAF